MLTYIANIFGNSTNVLGNHTILFGFIQIKLVILEGLTDAFHVSKVRARSPSPLSSIPTVCFSVYAVTTLLHLRLQTHCQLDPLPPFFESS